ncbi:MAG: sigma factor [Cyanobacteriota bacterium]
MSNHRFNIGLYKNLKNIPYLEKDEELIIIQKAQSGDSEALEKIVYHNAKLLFDIITPCKTNYRYDEDDLFQESCIGLLKAINTYKSNKNVLFRTYALYSIKSQITKYIINNFHCVKIPKKLKETFNKIKEIEDTYLLENNYSYPGYKYIANKLNIEENQVVRCIEIFTQKTKSYYELTESNNEI